MSLRVDSTVGLSFAIDAGMEVVENSISWSSVHCSRLPVQHHILPTCVESTDARGKGVSVASQKELCMGGRRNILVVSTVEICFSAFVPDPSVKTCIREYL